MRERRVFNLLRPDGKFTVDEVVDIEARKSIFREIGRTILAKHGSGDTAMRIMRAMEQAFKAGQEIGANPAAYSQTTAPDKFTLSDLSPRARAAFRNLTRVLKYEHAFGLLNCPANYGRTAWRVINQKPPFDDSWGETTIAPLVRAGLLAELAAQLDGRDKTLLVLTFRGRELAIHGSTSNKTSAAACVTIESGKFVFL
jgi:hypothetical protein